VYTDYYIYVLASQRNGTLYVGITSKRLLKKRCRILPAGGMGVSPSLKNPPRLGD